MPQRIYLARLDALGELWDAWIELGERLAEPQWTTPTRCPGWDVAAVWAHLSMITVAFAGPALEQPTTGDVLTADEVLRRFNQSEGIAHTMAEQLAASGAADAANSGRSDLLERFTRGRGALGSWRAADAMTMVPWPGSGGVSTLVESLRIVIMESVVHLLDVQRALGLPPDIPAAGLRETTRLLADVAPAVEFVEAAAGRSSRSPFPVLR